MRFLVTGGAGFIGSHAADVLLARGDEVVAFDNLSTGRLDNIRHLADHPGFRFELGDVLDQDRLEPLVRDCDVVLHLAAAVGVRLIMENPVRTIVTNVQGTENVLLLANRHRRKVFVASTSEVYGKLMDDASVERLREDSDWRLGPTSKRRWAYACSKAMDEFLALAYFDEKRLPVVVARFFNTVGPRQTGRYGMVIPNLVRAALMRRPLRVHGDGTQTRCFTHVHDAVRAMLALVAEPSAEGQVFNIGSDEEISINDLARRIIAMTGSDSTLEHVPYEQVFGAGFEDMRRRTPDLSKIRAAVGYRPSLGIEDILRAIIEGAKADAEATL